MAQRATSLGPKPSLFLLFYFFSFFVFFLVFLPFLLFFGGFKGQVRWPKGPPHLALNPPHFIYFCFFCFLVFALLEKTCSPPKNGHFLCIFSVSPFVSL